MPEALGVEASGRSQEGKGQISSPEELGCLALFCGSLYSRGETRLER